MHLRLPAGHKVHAKRPRARREDPVHISILNYLRATLPKDWVIHHSPNGGKAKSHRIQAWKLGTVSGFPDLLILGNRDVGDLTPRIVPMGWLMEVKTKNNYSDLSSDQRKTHKALKALGWEVGTVRSIEDARALVIEWGLPSTDYLVLRERERAGQVAADRP